MTRALLLTCSVALLASACSGDPPAAPLDGGAQVDRPTPVDTGGDTGGDTGVAVDTGLVDAGPAVDAGDAGLVDSGGGDAVVPSDGPRPTGTWCDLPVPRGGEVPSAIRVPDGFCIRRFALADTTTSPREIPLTPRVLAFAPSGELFVSSPSTGTPGGSPQGRGAIVRLTDSNFDGLADTTAPTATTFLGRVDSVHGLLFSNGFLYYTVDDAVMRLPYQPGDVTARAPVAQHDVVAELDFQRWTHTLAQGTDGSIYVSMGQYDVSTCPAPNPRQGSVLRVGGTAPRAGETIAVGFRNPMYLRCKAWGACYAMELTHDGWGGIGGTEKLVELRRGDDYGFPCCIERGRVVPGVQNATARCAAVTADVQQYRLQDTPFGFDWAPSSWPAPYAGSFFGGFHGAVGSWVNAGVRWAPVDTSTHRPNRAVEFFVSGFGRTDSVSGQRVADLVFAPDGRMFFSDDQAGAIYWVAPRNLAIR
ncbi:MAG: hypothetical protein JNK72_13545 [Myxococcales bacterium]|nr:hypothetical protein [Myxococcales bacterium]